MLYCRLNIKYLFYQTLSTFDNIYNHHNDQRTLGEEKKPINHNALKVGDKIISYIKVKDNLFYIGILVCFVFISISTGFPYDEASFFSQFYNFYIYGGHPFYYWPFGVYYYILMMASYLVNLPFALFGLDNVMVQEFSIKLPFMICMFLTAVGIYLILRCENINKKISKSISWLFILTPIVLFDVIFHGNGMIISIFFETFSILFLYRNRYHASAIFLGIASATYLFPAFFLLPILRLVNFRKKLKGSITYFGIFTTIIIIGQGLPLLVYYLYGIPLSQGSVLGGIIGITPSGVLTNTISTWGPYFIIEEITGYIVSMKIAVLIFIAVMTIPSIIFIIFKKNPQTLDVLEIIFIESLLFVIFGMNSAPQYLIAIAPFSLILFSIQKNDKHLLLLTLLTLLDIGQFIAQSPLTLFSFFWDLNPQLRANYIVWPKYFFDVVYSLYWILLFVYLIYFINSKFIKKQFSHTVSNKREFSLDDLHSKINKSISLLVIFTILIVGIVAPVMSNPPTIMLSIPSLNEQAHPAILEGNNSNVSSLSDNYSINMGKNWGNLNNFARVTGSYTLCIPKGMSKETIMGDFGQTLALPNLANVTYSEDFHFPKSGFLQGYFVIFGTNITPYLSISKESSPNFSLNLTKDIHLVQRVYGTHNYFKFVYDNNIQKGNYVLSLKVPEMNSAISATNFNQSGANFTRFDTKKMVQVNSSSIPTLMVNSSYKPNLTLSLYLILSPTILISLNGKSLGNFSTQSNSLIPVPSNLVKESNTIEISGHYCTSLPIYLYYEPPFNININIIFSNIFNSIFVLVSGVITVFALSYLYVYIRKNIWN